MHKVLCSNLLCSPCNRITAGNKVLRRYHIGRRINDERVFVGFACKKKNVGPFFFYAFKGFRRSGNGLIYDDGLHFGIVGQSDYLRNGGFLLGHHIVGIGDVLNHSAVLCRTVQFYQLFRTAQIIFRLGNGSRHHTDVVGGLSFFRRIRFCIFTLVTAGRKKDRQRQQNTCCQNFPFHKTTSKSNVENRCATQYRIRPFSIKYNLVKS